MSTSTRTVVFEGREFAVPNGVHQLSINEDEAAVLKREINKVIAENELEPSSTVIDAFSGAGFTSYLWAKRAGNVYCIEKDKDTFACLQSNLQGFSNVEMFNENNVNRLRRLEQCAPFKLIDLDPWSNFHEQLPLVPKLMKDGILLLTNGELFHMMRFASSKKYGDCKKYKGGQNYYKWVEEILLPHIISVTGCLIWYYYVFPTSVRIVATMGNYMLSDATLSYLSKLPKYIGRLSYLEEKK